MMNNKVKNNYLVSCVSCVLILMTICYFGINYIVKGTRAGFGGVTGCMNASIDLVYSPNYPDGFEEPEIVTKKVCNSHFVLDNMYEIPLGYEFIGWNTSVDGTGTMYQTNSVLFLYENKTLYAQWNKKIISYGDLNIDGSINEEDYLLLQNHLDGSAILNDEILLSADVNGDSKVDEIDLDIIKQVNLGTSGYVGYLPVEIVPIYEIYVPKDTSDDGNLSDGDKNDSTEDDKKDPVMGPGSSGHTSGSGNGTGSAGSGNSSTGSGGNSVKPSTGTNKPNNNSTYNNQDNNINKEEVFEHKTYKFKFIVDGVEYDNTKCDTGNSKSCKLVLPEDTPIKKGYKFNGWSTIKDCPSNVGINYTVLMEDDATYYACFLEVEEDNVYSIVIISLIILIIWILSIVGIVYLIKRFKKTEIKD